MGRSWWRSEQPERFILLLVLALKDSVHCKNFGWEAKKRVIISHCQNGASDENKPQAQATNAYPSVRP